MPSGQAHNKILFDFESLVDYRLTLLSYIKFIAQSDKFKSTVYDLDYIRNTSMNEFKLLRVYSNEDILRRAVTSEKYYKTLIEYYDTTLAPLWKALNKDLNLYIDQIVITTSMVRLINTYMKIGDGAVIPTILCRFEEEELFSKRIAPGVKIIKSSDRSKVDITQYGRVVLGDIKTALEFDDPATQDFLVLNYRTNFTPDDDNILDPKVIFTLGDVNQFTVADAYPEIKVPEG